jgi:hypothetical protein
VEAVRRLIHVLIDLIATNVRRPQSSALGPRRFS